MCPWNPVVRNRCIVCGEREGTISIQDGLVCGTCMPRELLGRRGTIRSYQVTMYQRSRRGERWENCETVTPQPGPCSVSGDRSMVVTTFDTVVLADEFNREIETAGSVDIVVSFILCSGLNLIIDSLRRFTEHGRLRVITTTYMGNTEYEAVDQLMRLPNTEVRMELSTGDRRLHAKAFLFGRPGGRSTAYVGSANLSRSAITTGEEWEVKIREQDLPEAVEDVRRSFQSLWESTLYTHVTVADRAMVESALEKAGRR